MANNQQADTNPVTEPQDASMPDAKQQSDLPSLDTVSRPTERQEEQAASINEGDELLDTANERTKTQFEKLRQQLRDEKARRLYIENSFNQIKPKAQEEEVKPLYDPVTGVLNESVFTDMQKRVQDTSRANQQLERTLNELKEERSRQALEAENREAYQQFPQLNPDDKKTFDRKLHVATRQIMLDSMMNPHDYDNKQLSFIEAAKLAQSGTSAGLSEAKREGADEALKQLTPKEQAALSAVGSPARRNEVMGNYDELRSRTRHGDPDASIRRMKSILGEK